MKFVKLLLPALMCASLFADTPPPPTGAKRDLSNLSTTSINQSLIFNAATAGLLKTVDQAGSTNDLTLTTGTGTNGDNTGNMFVRTGNGVNTPSGQMQFGSGAVVGDTNSGNVSISSGSITGTGTPGGVTLFTGADTNGTRGPIKFLDGSEGTIGNVWTSVDTNGQGQWGPAGAHVTLDNIANTALSTNLVFGPGVDGGLSTYFTGGATDSKDILFSTGSASVANSGNLIFKSGDSMSGASGGIKFQFGSAGTTPGKFQIQDGSEGTAGNVWTSTDTSGTGHWATPSSISTPVSLANGGTHADLSATGGTSRVLKQTSTGANITVAQLACADLSNASASCATDATNAANIGSGTLPAARLPNPSATTLGGVQSIASASHNFLTSISTSGVPAKAQPVCADLSNAAASCSTDTTNAANITTGNLTMAGNIVDGTDNTHNIGAASGVTRFANGYFGTSMNVGWNPRASGHSQTAIVPAAIEIYGGGSNAYTYQLGPSTGIAISNVGSGGRLITLADPSVAFASGTTGVNYLTATAGLMNFFGHIRATTTAPTVTVNANAGTSAASTVTTATDVAGILNLTLGSGAWASGAQTKVNFNAAYTTAPIVVVTANNAATATNEVVLGYYVTSTVNDFTINFANAGSAATVLKWNYYVIETQ